MSEKQEIPFINQCFPVGTEINLAVTILNERTAVDLLCLIHDRPPENPELLNGLRLNEVSYFDVMKQHRLAAEQMKVKLSQIEGMLPADSLSDLKFLIEQIERTAFNRAVDARVTGDGETNYKHCGECQEVKHVHNFHRSHNHPGKRVPICMDCELDIYRDIYNRLGRQDYQHPERVKARKKIERPVEVSGINYTGTYCKECRKLKPWENYPTVAHHPTGHSPYCAACTEHQNRIRENASTTCDNSN